MVNDCVRFEFEIETVAFLGRHLVDLRRCETPRGLIFRFDHIERAIFPSLSGAKRGDTKTFQGSEQGEYQANLCINIKYLMFVQLRFVSGFVFPEFNRTLLEVLGVDFRETDACID